MWVTGASSGLGAALAAALARGGARLVVSGRDPARLEAVRAGCGEGALSLPFDLADPGAVREAPSRAEALLGGLDLLICNAGMGQRGTALETAPEVVARIMAVNFLGPVELARGTLPGMIARGAGRVAAVTSLLAKFGAPRRSAYAASKHALHGWFDSLRAELRGTGVGVTLLVPGWIRTGISQAAAEADGRAHGILDAGQARGLGPAEGARRMLRALAKGKDEQLIGGRECGAAYLRRLFPGLLDRIVAKKGIG